MSTTSATIKRPPVVAIMGHVDHGKSTLLDYIRKSNVVDGEAGGITQHIDAYEVTHEDADGNPRNITFIDTPGHAAFTGMRTRGAAIADIAILIVSAEDGVKQQTIEAINIIHESKVPYVVAINKIDKPNAQPERVKTELMEHKVFLEGFGGDISYAEISAKTGHNIDELLETILLVADIEEFSGDPTLPATGFVVESHMDEKRGTSAVLIVKNGTLSKGSCVVVHDTYASTRIMETFAGETIDEATFSSPVVITGFNNPPEIGAPFTVCANKKEAEKATQEYARLVQEIEEHNSPISLSEEQVLIPIILKTDVAGTAEAIIGEIEKLSTEDTIFKVVKTGAGNINESDVQRAQSDPATVILGFNVARDKKIESLNGIDDVSIETFDIIYKMVEWLEELYDERRPRKEVEETEGVLTILRTFSSQKNKHVIGGKVTEGVLKKGATIKLIRRDTALDYGTIKVLQQGKIETDSIQEGNECGVMIECKHEPAQGDTLVAFTKVTK